MGLLPDIEDGKLKADAGERKLYTPRRTTQPPTWDVDTSRPDPTHRGGAPTMANIHECSEDIHGNCYQCGRTMLV